MTISWLKMLRAAPGVKNAIDAVLVPGAGASKTVWYNLVKAAVTVLAACGIYLYLSAEEIETISSCLALAVPALLTLLDVAANLWLRVRTKEPLAAKAEKAGIRQ